MAAALVASSTVSTADELPTETVLCEYPRQEERPPFEAFDLTKLQTTGEREPNDRQPVAEKLPLGFGPGLSQDIDLSGSIGRIFDQDWLTFDAKAGETLGLAVLSIDERRLDSTVTIHGASGEILLRNDNHGGVASYYPPASPFPAGGTRGDAGLTFTVPQDGTYAIMIGAHGASIGSYVTQIRLRRPPMSERAVGSHQVLFLDFDGAEGIDADKLFGAGGVSRTTLSPLASFLPSWGLSPDRDRPLSGRIVELVKSHFDELLGTTGKIEITSSLDGQDPFGKPSVSRVIVGGRISELGISTIGISQFVDPGNFSTEDTAVVLLDLLSAPASNPNSVLSLQRDPAMTLEEAIASVVAKVVVHEAGHFLGCWHTENSNGIASTSDKGGDLGNLACVGHDGLIGSHDDPKTGIVDDYYAAEGIGDRRNIENVQAQIRSALLVGTVDPKEEVNNIQVLIDALATAQSVSEALQAPPTFSPADTRRILGLPAIKAISAPRIEETPEFRYKAAIGTLQRRMNSVRATF